MEIRTFGSTEASATVTVRAQVTGILTGVHFRKGQDVAAADKLFTIDRQPFEAALRQAEAALDRDKAQARNAKAEAEREAALLAKGVSSKAEKEKREADADALAALVRADEAAVENAQLQLGYCTIRSPISGRTGELLVDQGNLVKANDVPLVVINQIRPIEVRFAVTQAELPEVKAAMARGALKVQAATPQQEDRPEQGTLSFIDNAMEKSTGTIQMRATFGNPDERLWPGQYLLVKLVVGQQEGAIVVPAQAVQNGRDGTYVFVVRQDETVALRPVTVSRTYDGQAVVEGVRVGERVVTDGHVRLADGSKVQIKPAVRRTATAPASAPAFRAGRT
jgi:multidrug efflux system membrane fusion protein